MMQALGIYTRVFSGDLGIILSRIRTLGLTHFHLNPVSAGLPSLPVEIEEETFVQIKVEVEQSQLQLCGISATFNMVHPNRKVVEEGMQAFQVFAQISPLLGNPMLSLCTGSKDPVNKWKYHPENDSPKSWIEMCRILEQLILIAEKYDIYLGIEPEQGNVVSDASKAANLLRDLQSDRLTIIFDPANIIESIKLRDIDLVLSQSLEMLAVYVKVVHVKDRDLTGEVCSAGKGVVDFGSLWKRCQEFQISPAWVMHDLPEEEVEEVIEYLQQNINRPSPD